MRLAVAKLDRTVRELAPLHLSREQQIERELKAIRAWRAESRKRYIRPSQPPKA